MTEESRSEALGEAERLYSRYLEDRARGEAVEFEPLCARHPDHAVELRRIHANWERIDRAAAALRMDGSALPGSVTTDRATDAEDGWLPFLRSLELERDGAAPRYRIDREVGSGGMGTVLRVFDRGLRRELAMKVILPTDDRPTDAYHVRPQTLGRFVEEAQVTAQLDHPGIVPIHELGLDADGRIFFTMKLVTGEDLAATFEKVRTGEDGWSLTRALGVLLQACEALAFAHERGVVHRDLKPANIMVGPFGAVYVMDWGLARLVGDIEEGGPASAERDRAGPRVASDRRELEGSPGTPPASMEGQLLGTPSYAPPEQLLGRRDAIDGRADVYSMGAILYELLSGRRPCADPPPEISSREELARFLASRSPPALAGLRPDAPAELVAICERAMQRGVAHRYPDMSALANDLRAYLEHRVVAAYETGAWAELKKWVERNRAIAATIAVAFTVAVALSVALLRRGIELERASHDRRVALERDVRNTLHSLHIDAPSRTLQNDYADYPSLLDEMLKALAGVGVDLRAPAASETPVESVRALRARDESMARVVVDGLHDAELWLLDGQFAGAYRARSQLASVNADPGRVALWSRLDVEHPDLVDLWPRVRAVVDAVEWDDLRREVSAALRRLVLERKGTDLSSLPPARDAADWEYLGLAHFVQGDGASARDAYEEAFSLDRTRFWPAYRLSFLYGRKSLLDHGKAIRFARLALRPDSVGAWLNYGQALSRAGCYLDAIEVCGEAIRIQPLDCRARYNIGLAYEQLDSRLDAAQAFSEAVECDPGNVKYRASRMYNRALVKDYAGAEADRREILARDPADWPVAVLGVLADHYAGVGKKAEEAEIREALQRHRTRNDGR